MAPATPEASKGPGAQERPHANSSTETESQSNDPAPLSLKEVRTLVNGVLGKTRKLDHGQSGTYPEIRQTVQEVYENYKLLSRHLKEAVDDNIKFSKRHAADQKLISKLRKQLGEDDENPSDSKVNTQSSASKRAGSNKDQEEQKPKKQQPLAAKSTNAKVSKSTTSTATEATPFKITRAPTSTPSKAATSTTAKAATPTTAKAPASTAAKALTSKSTYQGTAHLKPAVPLRKAKPAPSSAARSTLSTAANQSPSTKKPTPPTAAAKSTPSVDTKTTPSKTTHDVSTPVAAATSEDLFTTAPKPLNGLDAIFASVKRVPAPPLVRQGDSEGDASEVEVSHSPAKVQERSAKKNVPLSTAGTKRRAGAEDDKDLEAIKGRQSLKRPRMASGTKRESGQHSDQPTPEMPRTKAQAPRKVRSRDDSTFAASMAQALAHILDVEKLGDEARNFLPNSIHSKLFDEEKMKGQVAQEFAKLMAEAKMPKDTNVPVLSTEFFRAFDRIREFHDGGKYRGAEWDINEFYSDIMKCFDVLQEENHAKKSCGMDLQTWRRCSNIRCPTLSGTRDDCQPGAGMLQFYPSPSYHSKHYGRMKTALVSLLAERANSMSASHEACQHCGEPTGTKLWKGFGNNPEVLSFSFNRCEPKALQSANPKRKDAPRYEVNLPTEFDFKQYFPEWVRETDYALGAVIKHHGADLDGGRYTAYVQNSAGWWRCQGQYVEPVNMSDINSGRDGDVCMAFYKRKDNIQH